jgi:hypothetical protein
MALLIDIETTGLPNRNGLSYGKDPDYKNISLYNNSRIVQIGMMICNEAFEKIDQTTLIIKSDGFPINNSNFHGITDEISQEKGVLFSQAIEKLLIY